MSVLCPLLYYIVVDCVIYVIVYAPALRPRFTAGPMTNFEKKNYLILLSWGIIIQIMYYLKTKGSYGIVIFCLQHLQYIILFQIYKAITNRVCRKKQPLTIIIPHRTFVSTKWRAWHSFVELLSPLILLEASRRNKYLHSRHLHFPGTLPLTDCRRESF